MAMDEARKRANKKWNDENMNKLYDRVTILVPKGKKAEIQKYAAETGESVSALMGRLFDEAIEKDR